MDRFDVVVVGAGVAGMQAAFKATARGKRTALIEKERLGGTCMNRGCIPTKALIRSAEVAQLARRGREFGVELAGGVRVDLPHVIARKDRIVDHYERINEQEVADEEAMTLVRGVARFEDPQTLVVGGRRIHGERIVLATGARTTVPDWPGVKDVGYLTSRTLLDLTELPERLVVVGGGYVAVECAQMFARFGSRVTLLQRSARILKNEDPDVVAVLTQRLAHDGVDVVTGAEVSRLSRDGDTRRVDALVDGKPRAFEGDALLLAVGRGPNHEGLGLDRAGITTWGPGWITVDDQLRTSRPHVWAVGDCIGRHLFTHVARYEVEVAIANALDGADTRVDYHAAPYAIFTDPELGRVGMTGTEAVAAGLDAEETSFTLEHVGKALCLGEPHGLVKMVTERGTGRLLGCHVLANHGAELVHEAVLVMQRRGTVDELADAIHIHPTMAEAVNDAAFEAAIGVGRRTF